MTKTGQKKEAPHLKDMAIGNIVAQTQAQRPEVDLIQE